MSPRAERSPAWKAIEIAAAADKLEIRFVHGGAHVFTTDSFPQPLIAIRPGELEDADADAVVRAACTAALVALKALPR